MPTSTPGRVQAPAVRLGATSGDGIAASIYALVERGVSRRPLLVAAMRGEVELRFAEDIVPVRLSFGPDGVLVEDGAPAQPDLVVCGRLPHIVALTTAPLLGGIPNPFAQRGRGALARVADGRVRIQGNLRLARRLLALMAL